MIMTGWCI